MASPKMTVTYDDGKVVVVRIGPRVQVEFEQKYKTTLMKYASEGSVEHTYYLSWLALHKSGQEPRSFEEFLDAIDDVENYVPPQDEDPEQGEPDPTQPAQQPEPSSS